MSSFNKVLLQNLSVACLSFHHRFQYYWPLAPSVSLIIQNTNPVVEVMKYLTIIIKHNVLVPLYI